MKLRMPDEVLETGDLGVHDEEAYPDEGLVTGRRVEPIGAMRAESVGSNPLSQWMIEVVRRHEADYRDRPALHDR